MAMEFQFVPARKGLEFRSEELAAAIRAIPAAELARGRAVTIADMEHALRVLEARLPEWSVRTSGKGASWQATIERRQRIGSATTVTQELGMYAFDRPPRVSIGGFDEDVIGVLGQALADRAGPVVFENDGGVVDAERLFRPGQIARRART